MAEWLVGHDVLWPLERSAPRWILTNYPAQNDRMTLLDGAVLVLYVGATALAFTALLALATRLTGRWSWPRFHHLVQTLVPMAACGVFLGLFSLTTTLLKAEGLTFAWLGMLRAVLLAGAATWSVWLAWRVAGRYAAGLRHAAATTSVSAAIGVSVFGWALLFFVW